MKTPENLHIGKLIREELRKNGQTVIWLTEELECDRAKLYRIFKNPHIYSDDLWKISLILKHNFFLDLANNFPYSIKEKQKKL